MKVLLSIIFVLIAMVTYGQNTRDVGPPTPPAPQYQAKAAKKQSFFKKKKKNNSRLEDQEAFERRMKTVSKQKRKEARLAKKPQYNDPLYFGHKKPPVKRPVGEQKFCKECQMKH